MKNTYLTVQNTIQNYTINRKYEQQDPKTTSNWACFLITLQKQFKIIFKIVPAKELYIFTQRIK